MNPLFFTDGYKLAHKKMYPEGTEFVYSNLTPRSEKHATNKLGFVIVAGIQMGIKMMHDAFEEGFFNKPKEEVCSDFKQAIDIYLNTDFDITPFEELHDLGYLPIIIKSLPEGSKCPIGVPFLTIRNTDERFFWLTNYLETYLSLLLWKPVTSATIAFNYRRILTKGALETDKSNLDFVLWQGHDFSMRGLDSIDACMSSAIGHLFSFYGSDSLPGILAAQNYYGAKKDDFVCGSVPASEHSVMCAGGKDTEYETYKRLITEVHPTGIVSLVSDTWDLWNVITNVLPRLKEEIMSREGKTVVRPDSGNPVDILCGINYNKFNNETYEEFQIDCAEYLNDKLSVETPHGEYGGSITETVLWNNQLYKVNYDPDWGRYDKQYYFIDNYGTTVSKCSFEEIEIKPSDKGVIELLWDIFSGTINEQGYKVLDPHIGLIYGDGIGLHNLEEINSRLKAKGFATTNWVAGFGSYGYQYNTRDTYGMAVKATHVVINGEGKAIFKDPITAEDKTKKSATGLLCVIKEDGKYILKQNIGTKEETYDNELKSKYINGIFHNTQTLQEIREVINNSLDI